MSPRFLNMRFAAVAVVSAAIAAMPAISAAQDTAPATLRVLIDGTVAGTATAAENLPTAGTVLHQDNNPTLPSKQVVASGQGTVVLVTADTGLISTMQAWMKADNSGYKDTVQRKTVEIDRMTAAGNGTRYQLSGSWPTKIEAGDGGTMITIVYQSLAPIP
jgi:hypothetical protein